MDQQVNTVKNTPLFFSSAFAAAIIAHPFLTLRNRSQVGLGFTLNPKELFIGFQLTACSVALTYSVISTSTKAAEKHIETKYNKKDFKTNVLISLLGGFCSALFAVPIEQAVLLTHAHCAKTPIDALKKIYTMKGPLHLYNGFTVSVFRNTVISLFLRNIPQKNNTVFENFYALFLCAATGFVTTPFERIRSEQQLLTYKNKYFSLDNPQTFMRFLYNNTRMFFKGALWRAGWFTILLSVYTQLNTLLLPNELEDAQNRGLSYKIK